MCVCVQPDGNAVTGKRQSRAGDDGGWQRELMPESKV